MKFLCKLGIHLWGYSGNAWTQAPAPIRCDRCGTAARLH
jgi:hypothetical protein